MLFLAFDGVSKLMKVDSRSRRPRSNSAFRAHDRRHRDRPARLYRYLRHPETAVLGAILLTGYLGGATAIHVRAGSGTFPIVFAIAFGVLVWVGLVLREPRLLRTILQRQ